MDLILLHIMRILALLSFLISSRLTFIFFKLKRNMKNAKVLPLANVLLVKNLIFSIMSFLITFELAIINIIPSHFAQTYKIHWIFGTIFIFLLFVSQLYLYWLAEMRNGWH